MVLVVLLISQLLQCNFTDIIAIENTGKGTDRQADPTEVAELIDLIWDSLEEEECAAQNEKVCE